MRKASGAVVAMLLAIALYYTLFWGIDALRVLTSSSYGFDDVYGSQYVFGVGRLFRLGPEGLIRLAAFFAAMKLATAAVFATHIADRLRCIVSGAKPNAEILEAGLILVVALSIAAVVPALVSHNLPQAQQQTIELLLAGLAAALAIIERSDAKAEDEPVEHETAREPKIVAPPGATWFTPWR
ncbi:MAG: hypothetical protein ACREDY_21205 [Bradyrhizobium sp.]